MIALRADRIFDGERLLEENVVLLDDGKVVAVAREAPPETPVRELPGTTILPGLIDAHVHLTADAGLGALDRLGNLRILAETAGFAATTRALAATIEQSLRLHLAAGVTTVRDLGDPYDAVLKWREHAPAGLPTVVASGTPLTSRGGHCWTFGGEAAGVDEVRAAVRTRAENGADVIKIMASGGFLTPGTDTMSPQFTRDELAAAVIEAHALGLPITAHAHALPAVRQGASTGSSTARASRPKVSSSTTSC
jgi:imidazolonepropionase-like amidohydrolase